MKRNFLALMCFFGLAFSASVSQAIYVEPYLGMIMSSSSETEVPSIPATSTSDISGTALGLRLGWSFVGVAVGIDYSTGSTTAKDTTAGGTGAEADSKMTNMGIFAAYELPIIPLQVYGAYILDSKIDPETAGDDTAKGSGLKIGAGFTGLPFVAINLDYSTLKYDESDPAATTPFETNAKIMMLSVSLPLDL